MDKSSLSHSAWKGQYHIVFISGRYIDNNKHRFRIWKKDQNERCSKN